MAEQEQLTIREEKELEHIVALIHAIASPLHRIPKHLPMFMSRHLHRTIQQNFTRLCVAWLEYLATKKEGEYDARNEDSVRIAKEFVEKVENRYLSYI